MEILKSVDCSVVSFLILAVVLIHSYNRYERVFVQYQLFFTMVIFNMSLIIIDLCSWVFNGLPGSMNHFCNISFNILLYIMAPTIPSVWVLYTYCLIYNNKHKIRIINAALLILLSVNACIAILSQFTGWYFYTDAANIYHRGALFPFHMGYCILLVLYSIFFVVINQRHFQKRQFSTIMLFYIAPLIGVVIQIFYNGLSYNWAGTAISLLFVYLNLQSRNLNTDYLTGANNRNHFQVYIKEKIRGSSEKKTFGAIMIDIDNFKKINDNFGHVTGDEALRDTVQILKGSIRRDDFIARFGGDEFLVVVDVQTLKTLENTIKRIKNKTELFNAQNVKPYKLSLSLGYDLYNVERKMKPDEFLDHLDRLMYEDKRRKLKADK